MKKINLNLFPKTGFKFKEADGTVIMAQSWAAVINRVRVYRARNGIPPGDPEREVQEQACAENSVLCSDAHPEGEIARQTQLKVTTLKGRVLQWFNALRRNGEQPPLVEGDVYKQRVEICAACPQKTALPEGCASCRKALDEMKKHLLGNRHRDARVEYHGCNVLGADITTQAWMDLVTTDKPGLPDNCWRKRANP